MPEVPDVDFIRPCGVVVFAMFYCYLDLCYSRDVSYNIIVKKLVISQNP